MFWSTADSFLEVHARWAREVIVGYARLDGRAVGIVANQPKVKGGVLFVDSSDKAARFIWTCNAFNIPLLFLADVPGFMIGTQVEREGIIRHGAKMISAVSEANVPKISVIVRKAYGAGLYAMAGPAFDPDCCLALPTASIAVMGPSAAINAVYYNQLQAISDEAERAARTEELRREYAEDIDILHLASELVIDAVIQPEDLRSELIRRSRSRPASTASGRTSAIRSRRCSALRAAARSRPSIASTSISRTRPRVERVVVDLLRGVGSLVRAGGEPAVVQAADRDRRQASGARRERRRGAPAAVGGRGGVCAQLSQGAGVPERHQAAIAGPPGRECRRRRRRSRAPRRLRVSALACGSAGIGGRPICSSSPAPWSTSSTRRQRCRPGRRRHGPSPASARVRVRPLCRRRCRRRRGRSRRRRRRGAAPARGRAPPPGAAGGHRARAAGGARVERTIAIASS